MGHDAFHDSEVNRVDKAALPETTFKWEIYVRLRTN